MPIIPAIWEAHKEGLQFKAIAEPKKKKKKVSKILSQRPSWVW
jgi:hypothetical protein